MPKFHGIVPMKGESLAPAGFSPNLTYHGGPLLTDVQVYTIFYGSRWRQMPQNGLIQPLNDFFDFLLTSSLMDQLGEYSKPGQTILYGSLIGTKTITESDPGTVLHSGARLVTDDEIQQALQGWISNHTLPQPNKNTLYFVYLPPNVVSAGFGQRSCVAGGYCGYHSVIDHTIYYAVIPYLDCSGCTSGDNQPFDSLTKVSSHELCEAITDPDPDPKWVGWNDDRLKDGEIGDICNSVVTRFGGYEVQTQWSNQAQACLLRSPLRGGWANQSTPPGGLDSGVGVVTVQDTNMAPQRLYVFVKGNDGNLWANWWDGDTWKWTNQGTPDRISLDWAVGVVTVQDTNTAPQRPYVFVKGNDGNLWVNWLDGSAWKWANQGRPTGGLDSAVGVVTVQDTNTAPQRPYVFVQGNDGNLWANWWDGDTWKWANQGTPDRISLGSVVGVATVMDTNTAPQRPYVFVQGNDGNLWANWWDGDTWKWANQGTPPGIDLTSAKGVVTVKDTNTAPQRPYVFVEGRDGNLWVNWWDGSAWKWMNQGRPTDAIGFGSKVGAVTVRDTMLSTTGTNITAQPQRPLVFVEGRDGNLWVNWWERNTWYWANQLTPAGIGLGSAVGVVTVMDTNTSPQRPYVFVQGRDGNLWVNWRP